MQIQNPIALLCARAAVATDDTTGDGTTSIVVLVGEMMRQAERHLSEGCHPRHLVEVREEREAEGGGGRRTERRKEGDGEAGGEQAPSSLRVFGAPTSLPPTPPTHQGLELAKASALAFLDTYKHPLPSPLTDRDALLCVARTALRTKLAPTLADDLAAIVADAVVTIAPPDGTTGIDLHMVEVLAMKHRLDRDTRLVKGLVLDHGARHPDMPRRLEDAFVLTANIGLEFERSEVNAGFFYSSAGARERAVAAERATTDARVQAVIDLKTKVCTSGQGFILVNQKGIDAPALDALARAGILGLRRAKRRNMERLVLACGGVAVNSVDELTPDVLGRAGTVFEHVLGEEKFTFIEVRECGEEGGVGGSGRHRQNTHSPTLLPTHSRTSPPPAPAPSSSRAPPTTPWPRSRTRCATACAR